VKRIPMLVIGLSVLGLATTAMAQKFETDPDSTAEATVEAAEVKSPFRGSMIVYENIFSPYQYSMADPTYDPYYAMSWSFRPRYYVRDDLSLRARFDVEVELTMSDLQDTAHEATFNDLSFDINYAPSWAVIPYLGIMTSTSLRLALPTSDVSQARSMILYLAPGMAFRRGFGLMKGDWLSKLTLSYSFRGTKYLHQYKDKQRDVTVGCMDVSRPECQHQGLRNRSWRFVNGFEADLQIWKKLVFSASFLLVDDLTYAYDEGKVVNPLDHSTQPVAGSDSVLKGAYWTALDLTYDLADWLSMSTGVTWYVPMLTSRSDGYRSPFDARYTQIYLDVNLPMAKVVDKIKTWVD